jgi:uncharacterized MAPEG superfamily protein
MTTITWLFLIAALLPLIATSISKAGAKGFDNNDPRPWLAQQSGWRARANSAQINLFEGLPFFYAAVLFALYTHADLIFLRNLMAGWIVLRLIYVGCYVWGKGSIRSLCWAAALIVNVTILFAPSTTLS